MSSNSSSVRINDQLGELLVGMGLAVIVGVPMYFLTTGLRDALKLALSSPVQEIARNYVSEHYPGQEIEISCPERGPEKGYCFFSPILSMAGHDDIWLLCVPRENRCYDYQVIGRRMQFLQ